MTRTLSDIQKGCSDLLKRLREKKGLSKSKMASLVGTSDHTWARYESGESAPTVPEFIYIYSKAEADPLRAVLDFIYPDIYKDLTADSDMDDLRKACCHFLQHVASDRMVREWNYLAFGEHGSSNKSQLEMFTMIDHLPMKYRYMIANDVMKYWEIASSHNELVGTDHIMPDIDLFKQGLHKGKEATLKGENSYNTTIKEAD